MKALSVPDVRPAVVPEGPTLQEILRPENLRRSERSSEKRGWITRVFTDDVYELDGATVVDRMTEDRHYIPDFGRFSGDPGGYTVEGRWPRYHIPHADGTEEGVNA